jgi:hypothetical protein
MAFLGLIQNELPEAVRLVQNLVTSIINNENTIILITIPISGIHYLTL